MYAKVNLVTNEIVELVNRVPDEIYGLEQETLNDLSVIAYSIPEFDKIGFWPVKKSYGATEVRMELDIDNKVALQYVKQLERPRVPIYQEAIRVAVPEIGNGTVEESDAPEAETSITCIGNVFTKMMKFHNAGDTMHGHKHAYDHPTLLAKGKLEVDYQGNKTVFTAPTVIYIKANTLHQLTALEDDTLAFCIHPLRDKDNPGDILSNDNIPMGINPLNLAAPLLNQD